MRATVIVRPRKGVLDPQGAAVTTALHGLGFAGAHDVRVGKVIDLDLEVATRQQALDLADAMCRQLLANPVIEDYEIIVDELQGAPRPGEADLVRPVAP